MSAEWVVDDSGGKGPWQALSGESARAYRAFTAYRDLGADRSVYKAYCMVTGRYPAVTGPQGGRKQHPASPPRNWQRWASTFRWRERARAYDEYLDRQTLQRVEQAARDAAERLERDRAELKAREIALVKAALDKAEAMLGFPLVEQRIEQDGRVVVIIPARWRLGDATRMLTMASAIGRRALGLPLDRPEPDPPIEDALSRHVAALSDEELRRVIDRLAATGDDDAEL